MKTGIHLEGSSPDPSSIAALASSIETVFRAAAETRMEQDTVRSALDLLRHAGSVNGASIANSSVHGGKSVHLHIDPAAFTEED